MMLICQALSFLPVTMNVSTCRRSSRRVIPAAIPLLLLPRLLQPVSRSSRSVIPFSAAATRYSISKPKSTRETQAH
jgi:hypothetical protein